MATLKVTSPFTVQLDKTLPDGSPRAQDEPTAYTFPTAGTYEDVPAEVAEHWYTSAHLEGYEPPDLLSVQGAVVMTPKPEEQPPAETLPGGQPTPLPAQTAAQATQAAPRPTPTKA
jgi:hypothetical protein